MSLQFLTRILRISTSVVSTVSTLTTFTPSVIDYHCVLHWTVKYNCKLCIYNYTSCTCHCTAMLRIVYYPSKCH